MCGLAINIASFAHLLQNVDFDAIGDHLALMHVIKSKAETTTTRIKMLLEILSSYSFNVYYIKGKDMVLSDFVSRQKLDNRNPHEIIPILFNMQSILHSRYYNIGKEKEGKYLVQTRLQAKSSGISLPEIHGIGKGLDPNILPEKQMIKPIASSKGIPLIKPRFGQGRLGSIWKIKTPIPTLINKPIVKSSEEPIKQPKLTSKVPVQESLQIHDKIIPIPDFAIPQIRSGDDSNSRMVKRKIIQDISREISMYADPIYRPPSKPTEIPMQEVPRNLLDFDPEINMDFEENSSFQEGVISEMYQR